MKVLPLLLSLVLGQVSPPTDLAAHRYVLSSGYENASRNYTMDPGLVVAGGALLTCYSRAADHYAPLDETGMVVRRSGDGGFSWSPEVLLADTPMAADRGCGLSCVVDADDGSRRCYASWTTRVDLPPGVRAQSRWVTWTHTDDDGLTWSPTYVIPASRTGTMLNATGGSTVEVWGDECVTSYWSRNFGDQCYRAWTLHAPIVDGVCGWESATASIMAEECTLNHNHYGVEYEEPALISDPWHLLGNRRLALLRVDKRYETWPSAAVDDRSCYLVESFDDGHTWSEPVFAFRCWSHPVGRVMANGALVVAVRDPTIGSGRGVLRTSWNGGASWDATPVVEYQDTADGMQIYAALVEPTPGIIALVSAQELRVSPTRRTRMMFDVISTVSLR